MPAYNSLSLISGLQEQTEQLLTKATSEWQMLPHGKFSLKPAANKWSANECLQHLNSYGDYYLPAIENAITISAIKKQYPAAQFTAGWLGNYFTKMMLPKKDGTIKNKMKAPPAHAPKMVKDSYGVIFKFIDQQEKLIQLLEAAKKIDLNQTKVPITIAPFIKLKLGDVFSFLIAHNQRHILQAEKALTLQPEPSSANQLYSFL